MANRLREILDDPRMSLGAMVGMPSSQLVEFCAAAGFPWVFLDGEHELVDLRACYDLCTAAGAAGVGTLVRVPANRTEWILGFAEAGADAVLVPGIRTRQDAEDVVAALRYPPLGRRGLNGRTRAAGYGLRHRSSMDYFASTTEHAMPAVMIEDVESIESISDIVEVDGLDIFVIGPNDLSGSLGVPGDIAHPEVGRLVKRAVEEIHGQGKAAIMLAHAPQDVPACAELGARAVMTSTSALFGAALSNFVAGFHAEISQGIGISGIDVRNEGS